MQSHTPSRIFRNFAEDRDLFVNHLFQERMHHRKFITGIPQHKRGAVQALNLQGLIVRFG